ncbi:hypothetical protein [Paenibacillus popilliae]|uniref:Uncharacterized protein n=1 Tax=Paenibacillus popilliae TaxID=78057 RepID=A0ABY3AXS3_PAEPP|nr:hypothetical protein [Paenibacillus sp. SDF0028]TQR46759.1 hypothetical protein C7Y44_03640 [Paenibacillus sp. SDF0028]
MAVPIVEFTNENGTSQVNSWDIGTVDAGSKTNGDTFLIWNNKGKKTAVSDMENCIITTKDFSGGDTGPLVTGKWIEVRVDSMNESTFTPIGGTNAKTIQAEGVGAGIISGGVNDGSVNGAKANYAKVTLRANVPALAPAGSIDFLTRVTYHHN